MTSNISNVYDIDGQSKELRLYPSHTDYVDTIDGITLTEKLEKDKQKSKDDLSNFISSLQVQLTGEVTGSAKCSSDGSVSIKTLPSKKYAQQVKLTGAVTGSAYADSFENGIVTIATEYDRYITEQVQLTGDVTGNGTVTKDGMITLNTKCSNATKVPLPVGSVQWSISDEANSQLSTCFGGIWECTGYIDAKSTEEEAEAFSLYVYTKIAL